MKDIFAASAVERSSISIYTPMTPPSRKPATAGLGCRVALYRAFRPGIRRLARELLGWSCCCGLLSELGLLENDLFHLAMPLLYLCLQGEKRSTILRTIYVWVVGYSTQLIIFMEQMKKSYLLIDFSDCLQTNVYVLGAVFLQLCKVLCLDGHPIITELVDPSLFIHRFTESLLGRKNNTVSETALRIVASMKRDWMQTGRKPSGLCGAALYISALSHGLNFSKSDIVTKVHICEATLTKRLIEFENTESGCLTIEEFLARADELDEESDSNQLPSPGQVLCKHKDTKEPHFAHGLCRQCYNEFIKISGGLQGGAAPPAFQRAERQRMEKAKEEKMRESGLEIEPCDVEHGSAHDVREARISTKDTSETIGFESLTSDGTILPGEGPESTGCEDLGTSACNDETRDSDDKELVEENFADIDDDEVNGYLIHNEEEKRYKTIIWETMNREYLEEQAAKEAALAREGTDTSKSRKERKRRRSADAKNSTPAQTAAEAAYNALERKGHSSKKINWEAFGSLFDQEKEKKSKASADGHAGDTRGPENDVNKKENASYSEKGEDGDDAINYEDGDYAGDNYGADYGNEDGDYTNYDEYF